MPQVMHKGASDAVPVISSSSSALEWALLVLGISPAGADCSSTARSTAGAASTCGVSYCWVTVAARSSAVKIPSASRLSNGR